MPLKLYKMDLSPPACSTFMICDIHNVPVEMIDVNLLQKDHLKPEYMQKNPMHTIPMLEDDDLILHDSHVILKYLTEKYAKDDSLYPNDIKKRAQIDQKLFVDVLLFLRVRGVITPAIFEGLRKPTDKTMKDLAEGYDFLEAFLSKTKFVAGDTMTIADISIIATVTAIQYIIPIDSKKYPKLQSWFNYMEKQSFYQKSGLPGLKKLEEVIKASLDL